MRAYFQSQMEVIVFIILHTFFATHAVLKIGEYSWTFPSFNLGIFGHMTLLDQLYAIDSQRGTYNHHFQQVRVKCYIYKHTKTIENYFAFAYHICRA